MFSIVLSVVIHFLECAYNLVTRSFQFLSRYVIEYRPAINSSKRGEISIRAYDGMSVVGCRSMDSQVNRNLLDATDEPKYSIVQKEKLFSCGCFGLEKGITTGLLIVVWGS